MRGIGWLTIDRDDIGAVELLNDLRFVKNADAAGGVITRNMADSDFCSVYNYHFIGCSTTSDVSTNSIWQMDTTGANPVDNFQFWDGGGGGFSGVLNFGVSAADMQTELNSYYGGGITVTGGPDVYVIEFGGGFAGTDVGGYVTVTGGAVDPFPALALGSWSGGLTPTFTHLQVGGTETTFTPLVPIDWTDNDPWVADHVGAQVEFLGFYTEDWQGLEGDFDRTANARAWGFGGSNFTPLRANHLAMTFTVILGATTERGLQYGFRWLTNQLIGLDACDRADLIVFDHCPPADTPPSDWIWWKIHDAGLLDAPRWGDVVLDSANCKLRRVTFVLGARDPHKYRCPVICTENTEFVIPDPATDCAPDYSWSEWFCNDNIDWIQCVIDPPTFDYSARAAIISISSSEEGSPPMEIETGNEGGICIFRTTTLPPGSVLIIDSSRHEIRLQPASGNEIDGSGYVAAAFGVAPCWAEIGPLDPAPIVVQVRALRICGLDGTSVTIETVDRV